MMRAHKLVSSAALAAAVVVAVAATVAGCHPGPTRNAGSGELQGAAQLGKDQRKLLVGGPVTITHVGVNGDGSVLLFVAAGKPGADADCVAGEQKSPQILAPGERNVTFTAPPGSVVCAALASGRDATLLWSGIAR